jgi:5-methylcytosine-specific restriction endonuclease McrA
MGLTYYQRMVANTKPVGRDVMSRGDISVYNCSRWQKIRARMMARIPLCPDPFDTHRDRAVAAEEVHHIVPVKANESLSYVMTNLIPLCRSCHKRADNLDSVDPQAQRSALGSLRLTYGA